MKKLSFLSLFIPFIVNAANDDNSFQKITLWGPGKVKLAHLTVAANATGKDIKRGYAKSQGDVEFFPQRLLLIDKQNFIKISDDMMVPEGCIDLYLIPRSESEKQPDLGLLQDIYDKQDLETLYNIGILVGDGFNPSLFKQ